ncbi:hypothetical protein B7P43_G00958 [Cryptotermes secundus]|uniref:RAP domain-containing protein n=1 Tax=Cryptotermes secundus TaxID=105785 RepID=A0A2J7PG57_9NEOP|nr:FAST kinase domain-containing protein 1, mitochondrial isoform X2 [Cryptotermes secundus]PNF15316.1 hypothetical protein B7P43_G00958 [Cryptotermes secundus]
MTGNIMTWFNIGRRSVVGRVSWLHKTQTLFSRKFINFGLVPKSLRRLSMLPMFRQFLIPCSTKLTCIVQVKYVHEGAESESDSELEDSPEEAIDLFSQSETLSFRQLLCCNSEHPLIKQLNASTSVQDVFNFVKEHEYELDGQLVSQVVVVLWDLQKSFSKVNVLDLCQNQVTSSLLNSCNILNNYINEVCGHQDFEMLLQLVDRWNGDMSVDALTATLLYLNKMGVSVYHPVMQKLISRCESAVECYGPRFPLSALSRFAVAVHSRRGLWPIFVAKMMLPRILAGIESCNNVADFQYLSICLINICQLVNCTLLNAYKSKVDDLVGNGIITAQDSKAITKAVRFLNLPQWSHQNDPTIRKLLLVLKGNICGVSPTDLITIHKVLQNMLEPADIVDEMHEAASQLLSQVENEGVSSSPIAFKCITDLLSCLVSFSSPTQKLALEKLVQQHIEEYSSALYFPALFRILRQLNTSNVELYDAFWTRTLDIMQNMPTEREYYKLFQVSHRYMYFNNNLSGRYRHYELERQMIQWLWNEVENGTIGILPSKFAQVTSFILAYGNIGQRRSVISESALTQMVCKVLDMKLQFSKLDCMYISRGLQIGKILASQRSISSRFLDVFTKIDTAMNSCAQQHLKEEVLSLPDITIMMRTYISRSNAWETQLFENLIKRHEKLSGVTSSKLLRDISASMLTTNCLIPSMSDQLVNYVVENGDHILGDTAVKLLYMCYSLGYMPAQAESFFSVASNVILRDKERMQVLTLLQAAIALCFFHRLPEELVHFIFTVDFLGRLDEEMLHCYAKESYCVRVRHAMMHLNRAVCIDYPETDVPWFHEKYCQQVAALRSPKASPFHDDVHQSLSSVMGTQKLVQVNMYSPYFYGVDFQVLLNRNKMPVSIKHQADSDITRIAILLWIKDAFTNGVSQLCGEQQLKQRHLEMMGYKVIGISSSVWNSMYMAEKNAKTDYLRQRIWPSTTDCNSEYHYKRS